MNVDGKRILIVDPDNESRASLASFLRRQTFQVEDAADSRTAIEKLSEHRYSVVLLDVSSDGERYDQLLQSMASVPAASAPIVLLLAGSDPRDAEGLDPQRVHGVIRKPFDFEELAELVRACAEIKSRNALGTMCMATMLAGGPILALLSSSKL
jgi:two-component system response regulator AtoC